MRTNKLLLIPVFILFLILGALILFQDDAKEYLLAFGSVAFIGYILLSWILRYARSQDDRIYLRNRFWLTFILLLTFAVLWYILLLEIQWKGYQGFFYDDEPKYDTEGLNIANLWSVGKGIKEGKNVFFYFNGLVYWIFGHYPLIVRFFSCLSGALTAVITYLIGIELYGSKPVARFSFWFVAFAPIFLFWSIAQMRDIQMALCVSLIVWGTLVLLRAPSLGLFALLSMAYTYLYFLRHVMVVIPLACTVLYMFFNALGYGQRMVHIHRRTLVVSLVVLLVILSSVFVLGIIHPGTIVEQNIDQYVAPTLDSARGRFSTNSFSSSFLSRSSLSPINIILTSIGTLLIPSPLWIITAPSFSNLIASLQGLTWYYLVPFSLGGIFFTIRRLRWRAFIVCSISIAVFFGGTLTWLTIASDPIRYRFPSLPLLAVFGSYGMYLYRNDLAARNFFRPMILSFCTGIAGISLLYITMRVDWISLSFFFFSIIVGSYLLFTYGLVVIKRLFRRNFLTRHNW